MASASLQTASIDASSQRIVVASRFNERDRSQYKESCVVGFLGGRINVDNKRSARKGKSDSARLSLEVGVGPLLTWAMQTRPWRI